MTGSQLESINNSSHANVLKTSEDLSTEQPLNCFGVEK
jgi:hypothetical protein